MDEWVYVEAWIVGTHTIPDAIATRFDLPGTLDDGDVLVLLPSGGFELFETEDEFGDAGYVWVWFEEDA